LRGQIDADGSRERLIPGWSHYGVVTLHRPSNVDDRESLAEIVRQLVATSARLPLIFPVHPRTRNRLKEFGLLATLSACKEVALTEPLGYIEFMNLVVGAKAVITDSGGVQEETTYLRIPCLTLRENTERPVTISHGSNRLVKLPDIQKTIDAALGGDWKAGTPPWNWDGRTAERCAASLRKRLQHVRAN